MQSIWCIPLKQNRSAQGLQLEIQLSRNVPFINPHPLRLTPKNASLSEPFWKGDKPHGEREVQRLDYEKRRAKAFDREKGLLSYPFRQAIYWLERGFTGIFRAFTNRGFLKLDLEGHWLPCKVDPRLAWALEEGRALDAVVDLSKARR